MNIKDKNNYNMPNCNWKDECFPQESKGWSNIRGYGE